MINSYYFVKRLSHYLEEGDIITTGVGTAYTGTHQVIELKKNQRFISNIGCGAMGYGLPAAIGASFATNKKRVILLDGEGGFQLNIQELQTIIHHKLPIKMFILNNNAYLAIKITQTNYFKKLGGIDPKTGISFPSLKKIALAYGIPYIRTTAKSRLDKDIQTTLKKKGAVIHDVIMPSNQKLYVSIKNPKFRPT
jgi:acetolactate synthase-1/2/3 large subunit